MSRKTKGVFTGIAATVVAVALAFAPAAAYATEGEAIPETTSPEATTSVVQEQAPNVDEPPAAPDTTAPDPEPQQVAAPVTSAPPADPVVAEPEPASPAAPEGNAPVTNEAEPNAPPAVTSTSSTDTGAATKGKPKPGKLQPVWCHNTGSGWKAQLGAKPSGGREEAKPLIGDFGWGTTNDTVEGQTLAHDRSSKLDAACGEGSLSDKLPAQSTDPYGDCYVPPTEEPEIALEATSICVAGTSRITFSLSIDASNVAVVMTAVNTTTGVRSEPLIDDFMQEPGTYESSADGFAIDPGTYRLEVEIDGVLQHTKDITVSKCGTTPVEEEPTAGLTVVSMCLNGESGVATTLDVTAEGDDPQVSMTVTNTTTNVSTSVELGEITWEDGAGHLEQFVPLTPGSYTLTVTVNDKTFEPKEVIVAKCDGDPTEPTLATASIVLDTAATCNAPSTVKVEAANATLVGELETTPGTHQATFKADDGADFGEESGNATFQTVSYTIDPATGVTQSTDPEAPCYKAPPTEEPEEPTPTPTPTPTPVTPVTPKGPGATAAGQLAATGGSPASGIIWAGLLALTAGCSLFLTLRRRTV